MDVEQAGAWFGANLLGDTAVDAPLIQQPAGSRGVHAKLRVLPNEGGVVGDVDGRPSGEREQAAIDRVRARVPDRGIGIGKVRKRPRRAGGV